MLDLLFWVFIFVVSMVVLVKSSDYFTDSAEVVGLAFGLPAFIVGVTIVSVGTSLPELASSLFAVFRGSSEIVAGNAVGSNIANILLVLGVAAIIGKHLKIGWELIHVDLPLLFGSAVLLAVTLWDGSFTLGEGLICLAGYVVYISYTVAMQKKHKSELKIKREKLRSKTIIILVLSAFFIYLGAQYTIESIIKLSTMLNIGTEIIAVSAVAFGTSLPELTVSLVAAKKGKAEIAVGNVLGSNIFNSFVVMGIPSFLGTLVVTKQIVYFALPVMIASTFLYFFITQDKEITKWEGWILVLLYIFFITKLFGLI